MIIGLIWTFFWMIVAGLFGFQIGDNHGFLRACKRFGDAWKPELSTRK